MKKTFIALSIALVMCACTGGPGTTSGQGVQMSDEQIEQIKNDNNPLREGTKYFHSSEFDYSVKYPVSYQDFKEKDGGFTCQSKDGIASITVTARKSDASIEEEFSAALAHYNGKKAEIEYKQLDDTCFVIKCVADGHKFYHRSIMFNGKLAAFVTDTRLDAGDSSIDPNAIYSWIGDEIGESLAAGPAPKEDEPVKVDPNAVAQVAYLGEGWTFSTLTHEDSFAKYGQTKDINGYAATTKGREIYMIVPSQPSASVTVKDVNTGEVLYRGDSKPIIVRCNEDHKSDVEITIIDDTGKLTKYRPALNNGRPSTAAGIQDITK